MPTGISIDSRLKNLEKDSKQKGQFTDRDRMMLDYCTTQIKFGFSDVSDAAQELANYIKVFGAKKIKQLMEEQEERERSARSDNQPTGNWKRLVESRQI